jgi:hypothetical protein
VEIARDAGPLLGQSQPAVAFGAGEVIPGPFSTSVSVPAKATAVTTASTVASALVRASNTPATVRVAAKVR